MDNDIGDEGAEAIADSLKSGMAVLTFLDLNYNNIGDDGAKAIIAEALKVNAVVTALCLDSNNIGPEGAKAIAEARKVTAVVTTLILWNNSIGNVGPGCHRDRGGAEGQRGPDQARPQGQQFGRCRGKSGVRDAVKDRSGFVLDL